MLPVARQVLQGVQFKEQVFIWEDLDFNVRATNEHSIVLCKCYRFGMYKKPMGSGCGDYVARPEVRAAAIYFVVNLS